MRIVRPEPELTAWQKAGWTREPRNGYEWKRMRAGKPQPADPDKPWPKPYRCHIHGKTRYKVVSNGDKRARRCVICGLGRRKTWYSKNTERMRKMRQISKRKARKEAPHFEDGFASVSATWLTHNITKTMGYLKDGNLVVEVLGEPAFVVTSIEKGRRL